MVAFRVRSYGNFFKTIYNLCTFIKDLAWGNPKEVCNCRLSKGLDNSWEMKQFCYHFDCVRHSPNKNYLLRGKMQQEYV